MDAASAGACLLSGLTQHYRARVSLTLFGYGISGLGSVPERWDAVKAGL